MAQREKRCTLRNNRTKGMRPSEILIYIESHFDSTCIRWNSEPSLNTYFSDFVNLINNIDAYSVRSKMRIISVPSRPRLPGL